MMIRKCCGTCKHIKQTPWSMKCLIGKDPYKKSKYNCKYYEKDK